MSYGKNNPNSNKYYIEESNIEGRGVFTKQAIKQDSKIDIGIYIRLWFFPQVTPYFGSLINHSWEPNTYLEFDGQHHWVKAKYGLVPDTEITLDYRTAPWYILGPNPSWR